ncbi:hypothetical protein ACQW02_04720 [Humitalea sp. 24SJ18S-53]|uniref:hypothetical protein n=1 Tax=Humitalea sp. 24SJ18S-53 TaxID=3422307 RepID=UPI003D671543
MNQASSGLAALAVLAMLGGCALPRPPFAALPPDSVEGAGDPTRAAIITTAYAFGSPAILANRPGEAAEAVARLQFLAIEIPTGPRWISFNPLAGVLLEQGAAKARAFLGVAPDAPPQAVIDGLFAVRRAMAIGDLAEARAVLNPAVFTAGDTETLMRLGSLPPIPEAMMGASLAQREMNRNQLERVGR